MTASQQQQQQQQQEHQQQNDDACVKTLDIGSTTFKVVGSLQVICALCLVVLTILEIIRYIGNPFYYGFWGGVFFVMAGFTTIWAGNTSTKHALRACIAASFIAVIMAVFATCSVGILLERYFQMEGVCYSEFPPSHPDFDTYSPLCDKLNDKLLFVVAVLYGLDLFFILFELGLALGISMKCCKALNPLRPTNKGECQKLVAGNDKSP
ncbi:uncharacterized protein LOC141912837 [Tubulanus polymorphus]|uniref:uncharacterized protein LOC141912837 n=1 Tax=Tubulanus polymorphus TaxID=672921 RepID=UPI003DA5F92D